MIKLFTSLVRNLADMNIKCFVCLLALLSNSKIGVISFGKSNQQLINDCVNFMKIPCSSPIRPKHVLETVETNKTNELRFIMTMHYCQKLNGEEDTFFTMDYFMKNDAMTPANGFGVYEKYHKCPNRCIVSLHYNVNRGVSRDPNDIFLQCDHRLSNCSVLSWTCINANQKTEELLILQMIEDMFQPVNPDNISYLILLGIIVLLSVFSFLYIKFFVRF